MGKDGLALIVGDIGTESDMERFLKKLIEL